MTVSVLNPEFASDVSAGTETARAVVPEASTAAANNPDSKVSDTHDPVANRKLLEQVTDGLVVSRWSPPLWILGTYFYGYAVASWLMTFAMLGLFRQFLSHPSPRIRYLADSSYWLYLIHLPLQFEISIQLGLWQAPSLLKFLIYNILTFAILLPTYHYLVRPTWLGFLLNGRLYPLRKSASAGACRSRGPPQQSPYIAVSTKRFTALARFARPPVPFERRETHIEIEVDQKLARAESANLSFSSGRIRYFGGSTRMQLT